MGLTRKTAHLWNIYSIQEMDKLSNFPNINETATIYLLAASYHIISDKPS